VVIEEKMRPDYWLGFVLCVSFSALQLAPAEQTVRKINA